MKNSIESIFSRSLIFLVLAVSMIFFTALSSARGNEIELENKYKGRAEADAAKSEKSFITLKARPVFSKEFVHGGTSVGGEASADIVAHLPSNAIMELKLDAGIVKNLKSEHTRFLGDFMFKAGKRRGENIRLYAIPITAKATPHHSSIDAFGVGVSYKGSDYVASMNVLAIGGQWDRVKGKEGGRILPITVEYDHHFPHDLTLRTSLQVAALFGSNEVDEEGWRFAGPGNAWIAKIGLDKKLGERWNVGLEAIAEGNHAELKNDKTGINERFDTIGGTIKAHAAVGF